ncbi:NaeI family type II restriction endonuclease [Actinomadura harenae]|uniref:NaeI family type II restriction endonuclease n=1 Tax=Actinomadura harenae TaxID=2483351 RepID=UPI001F3FC140|nr:NaeI family type II restriction endonuclease [Actinomadura harenae]
MAGELLALDPHGERISATLRKTYDVLLDGQHTGRYRWDELYKTEKTHFGTLLEINLQREFSFTDGVTMDFAIRDIDVDCKFSQHKAKWMIPPEAMGHLLLGLWASDDEGKWSAGLARVRTEHLNKGQGNRDQKRSLSADGRASIHWLFEDKPLPENVLLRLPAADVDTIFNCSPFGTKRVDMLFRLAQQRRISRAAVATVAQQDDYMKRVRGNGGSRTSLRHEGIVILGQYNSHKQLAETLGLPLPSAGEFVSVRLAHRSDHHGGAASVMLDGRHWVVALPDDLAEMAPVLPDIGKKPAGDAQ